MWAEPTKKGISANVLFPMQKIHSGCINKRILVIVKSEGRFDSRKFLKPTTNFYISNSYPGKHGLPKTQNFLHPPDFFSNAKMLNHAFTLRHPACTIFSLSRLAIKYKAASVSPIYHPIYRSLRPFPREGLTPPPAPEWGTAIRSNRPAPQTI